MWVVGISLKANKSQSSDIHTYRKTKVDTLLEIVVSPHKRLITS